MMALHSDFETHNLLILLDINFQKG
ncbi:MAG: hypothetical protein ACI8XC_003144 [Gammaproteobacteria bacterium]